MTRIGPRMKAIQSYVELEPGHTAHWYAVRYWGSPLPRWLWVYAAFERATQAGLVHCEKRGSQYIYWPSKKKV